MRIAFISDVHGNQHALEAVTSSNAFKRCDLSIFCGDIFGYFYSGKSILHLLRKNCTHMLRGNHDDFILQISKRKMDVGFYEKYGYAHEYALRDLSSDDLSFIKNLPINIDIQVDEIAFNISHGMPYDNSEYFYADHTDEQLDLLLTSGSSVYVVGHTHHQMLLHKNGKIIGNPGSVGQPRSGKRGAQWCYFDTRSFCFTFVTTEYDIDPVIRGLNDCKSKVKVYLVNKWKSLK